jgi:putative membrane protein
MKPRILFFAVLFAIFALVQFFPNNALAHATPGGGVGLWTAWNLTPEITLGTLLVAGVYSRGIWRVRRKTDQARIWRHVFFFAGVGAVYLALQSPLDAIAERSFLFHQIQHFLLRMAGPMLIFLAAPQGVLVAGTPRLVKQFISIPAITNRTIRRLFSFLGHPVVTMVLFVGVFYFWQIPEFHNLSLENDALHYVMHVSLMLTGLLFFWRVLDRRPPPVGERYGVRLMMLWLTILSHIVLGSYLTFKSNVLYSAYDQFGRLWFQPIVDEQLGSIFIWIPNSMMGLLSILIVVHMWGREETRRDQMRLAKLARHGHGWNEPPMSGADLIAQAAPKNKSMALGFAAFVACVFAMAILVGVINLMLSA